MNARNLHLLLGVICALFLCSFAKLNRVENVFIIDDSNWDEFLTKAKQDGAAVLFELYAPWCGHCKKLEPEYNKAATVLEKDNDPLIYLAKTDATENNKLAQQFGVEGYPTMFVFNGPNYDKQEYDGGRTASEIVSTMKKKAVSKPKNVKSAEELKTLLEKVSSSVVLGIFKSENEQLHKDFMKLASANSGFKFVFTTDTSISKNYDLKEDEDHVLIIRDPRFTSKKDGAHLRFDHQDGKQSLESFFDSNIVADVDILDERTISVYSKNPKPTFHLFFDIDWENNKKQAVYVVNRLKRVAKDYLGKLRFTFGNKKEHGRILEKLGLKKDYSVVIKDTEGQNYVFPKDVVSGDKFNFDELKHFIEDYLTGNLTPYLKSQPVPEKDEDDVKVVVGSTFKSIVRDTTKDVLIEFYAPWCGHCKSLAPIYSELAAKVKGNNDLVIAKMDATENEVPDDFDVKGYPTIFFVSKENKIEAYKGGRTLDEFISFLSKRTNLGDKRDEL